MVAPRAISRRPLYVGTSVLIGGYHRPVELARQHEHVELVIRHVGHRPHIAQLIRQNVQILQCESCQRILYYKTPAS
jgi:hypothetical protein